MVSVVPHLARYFYKGGPAEDTRRSAHKGRLASRDALHQDLIAKWSENLLFESWPAQGHLIEAFCCVSTLRRHLLLLYRPLCSLARNRYLARCVACFRLQTVIFETLCKWGFNGLTWWVAPAIPGESIGWGVNQSPLHRDVLCSWKPATQS